MKQVFALGGLLAVALVGSYMTWTDDGSEEVKPGEAVIYQAAVDDLAKVAWTSKTLDVTLQPQSDAKGRYIEIEVTERREKKPPPPNFKPHDHSHDGAPPDAAHPEHEDHTEDEADEAGEGDSEEPAEPVIETTVTRFIGNKAADDLLDALAPFVALRELDLPADADLSTFGFDEPAATLAVTRKSGEVSVSVGGETFGSKDRYVQYDNRYYLVDDQVLRPIQYGKTRLLERNLQPIGERDLTRVRLTQGDRSSEYVQANADDRAKSFWAAAETADQEHETAGTWLGKVFKMRARTYVTDEELPDGLTSVFSFTVDGQVEGEDQSWTVDVLQHPTDGKVFYAKSDFLRSHVELTASLATDAIADLDTMFATE